VEGAPFLVEGNDARLVSSASLLLNNGGFEGFSGNRLWGYSFHDQLGEVSFVET
jgi:hypothetical protein